MSGDALFRARGFQYRLIRPDHEPELALILLHGSAADETTMIPLAREIAPRALILAVRGHVMQGDERRWFRRITPVAFEQGSIRNEVAAFAHFVEEMTVEHRLDLQRTVFIGYSNGANLLSSLMLLRPGMIRRAALLRAMPVLEQPPDADLAGTEILVLAGERDETYGPFAPDLVRILRRRGAEVTAFVMAAGHEFGSDDAGIIRDWIDWHPASGQPLRRRWQAV